MEYLFTPAIPPSLPILGHAARFPVRRIFCVGQNYAEHTREMGGDPQRNPPFFFAKPAQAVDVSGEFAYPMASNNVHYEVELVVALDRGGTHLSAQQALHSIYGYAVGLDMTRRDLQAQAKQAGRPWEAAKAFDHSAPCSPLVPVSECGHPEHGAIWLDQNGERRQTGDLDQMIWKVPEIIVHLSHLFELAAGDLIFTGTPAGVGPVQPGDLLQAEVEGVGQLQVRVLPSRHQ
ncbi:fumarylacetoacetate hydrolase family protein [bacterium]|nr:fumarylacetoacetate hydrolase family protein [bacterium]